MTQHIMSDSTEQMEYLTSLMPDIRKRAQTLVELHDVAVLYLQQRPIGYEKSALEGLSVRLVQDVVTQLESINDWTKDTISNALKQHQPLKTVMPVCRVALLGRTESPPIFGLMKCIGKEETLARLRDLAEQLASSS